jgi:hypothetical protein
LGEYDLDIAGIREKMQEQYNIGLPDGVPKMTDEEAKKVIRIFEVGRVVTSD